MNYWHIQLHPDDKAAFPTEKIKDILKQTSSIGMGEWPKGKSMINQFKNEVNIGDIVLVRSDGPLALVKVVSEALYEDEPNEHLDWFQHRRKVTVLAWFTPKYQDLLGTRTVDGIYAPITFATAENSEFVDSWYSIILNETKMESYLNEIKGAISVLEYNHQIVLQGPPGTGKTRLAKEIAYYIIHNRLFSVEKEKRENEENELSNSPQYNLIQFHPAYSYEDFVRGIVAKPLPDGQGINYEVDNKILNDYPFAYP